MIETNLDRFSQGLPDPQQKPTYDFCKYSGDDIYLGDSYLETPEGDIIRDDLESVVGFYQLSRKWAGEEVV